MCQRDRDIEIAIGIISDYFVVLREGCRQAKDGIIGQWQDNQKEAMINKTNIMHFQALLLQIVAVFILHTPQKIRTVVQYTLIIINKGLSH